MGFVNIAVRPWTSRHVRFSPERRYIKGRIFDVRIVVGLGVSTVNICAVLELSALRGGCLLLALSGNSSLTQ